MKKPSTFRVNGNMIFKGHSSRLVWTSAIARRTTAFWMKREVIGRLFGTTNKCAGVELRGKMHIL